MYIVYILQSQTKNWHYIGQTSNIEARLTRHNAGRVPSTRNYKPFTVVRIEIYQTRQEAYKRERYLKALKGGVTFKKLISAK